MSSTTTFFSPELFHPDAIDPDVARFNRVVEEALASTPSMHTQVPADLREARERGDGPFGGPATVDEADNRSIDSADGPIGLRVIVPDEVRGVYLHLHGGGFAIGAPHHSDVANLRTATRCHLAVVSVAYRLAPEHPYPAGLDDCEAAACWLVENAQAEFGSDRLLIGGDSAGANLSVATLLRMRDRHARCAFSGANLVFGIYDFAMTPSVKRWGDRNLVLSTPIIEWFREMYAPPECWGNPDVSPLLGDLTGLPPALLTVGTLDPLLDDSLFMYARWKAAGNEAHLAVYPGGVHGFTSFPVSIGREACTRTDDFLAECLERPTA